MKQRNVFLSLVALVLVTSLSAVSVADVFQERWSYKSAFSYWFWNSCSNDGVGEWIWVDGVGHYSGIFNADFESNRFSHFVVQASEAATAVGFTTGQEYVHSFHDTFSFHNVNGVDEADQTRTWERHWIFVSKGADSNIDLKILSHFTINPDGTVTVDHTDFEVACKG